MPDLEKQIAEWRQEMSSAGIRNPEVLDELEAHLRERINGLVAAGITEPEAFQTAARELGEGAELKREFSKVHYSGIWAWRNNPLPLNLLAFCFVARGLINLADTHHLFGQMFSDPLFFKRHDLVLCAYIALFIVFLLLMGTGLYRRRNAWRKCVLGWSAYCLISPAITYLIYPGFWNLPHPPTPTPGIQWTYSFAGVPVSYEVFHVCGRVSLILTIVISISALYYLGRPSVRRLFHSEPNAQTA